MFKNAPGTLPTGLRKDVIYYVIAKTTDNFQVSYTLGGPAVTFTTAGTGTNSYDVSVLQGGTGRGTITGSLQLIPQAEINISTDQEIVFIVWNASTANNISSGYAYSRIKE